MKESEIQSSICDYLAIKRYFFWRNNNIPSFDSKTGRVRNMPKYSRNGVPDIILIKDGKFIGLEVKSEKGRQSDSQKQFQQDLEQSGGSYYIVRSIEDVQTIKELN